MSKRTAEVLLGRQPIIDRQGRAVAYELLFRDGTDPSCAHVTDDALATARVVQRAFGDLGISTVVGGKRAFVNLDAEWLHDAAVMRLPADQVVLEILESVEIDEKLVERCRALKAMGFKLALDDVFRVDPAHEPLLGFVDIVKIDVLQVGAPALAELVRKLRIWPTKLLAEKVDSAERARQCLSLGFDFLQGFLIGRPQLICA